MEETAGQKDMKAIVLEVKNGKAAVLREDGVVLKVRGNYSVGESIELKEAPSFRFNSPQMRLVVSAAVIVIALFLGGIYNYTTVQAVSYVTAQDGVGIEFVLNRRNQVIEVRATDESGEAIREQLTKNNIKGSTLPEAISAVNEIHHREMLEKDPEAEWTDIRFRATSDNERTAQELNHTIETMHEQFRNEHPEGQSEPDQPQETPQPADAQGQEILPQNPQEGMPQGEEPGSQGEPQAMPESPSQPQMPEGNPGGEPSGMEGPGAPAGPQVP